MKKSTSVFVPVVFFCAVVLISITWFLAVPRDNHDAHGLYFSRDSGDWCFSKSTSDPVKRLDTPSAWCPPKAPFYALVRRATKNAFVVDHFIRIPRAEFRQVGLIPMIVRGPSGRGTLAWATTNAEALVLGTVISNSGRDLSLALLHTVAPHPRPRSRKSTGSQEKRAERHTGVRPKKAHVAPIPHDVGVRSARTGGKRARHSARGAGWLFDRLSVIRGVTLTHPKGKSAGTIYVLADPNCPFCEEFYHRLAPSFEKIGKAGVRIVWVPVAFLKVSSIARAEHILAGGVSALHENETKFNAAHERGGLSAAPIAAEKPRVVAATQAFFNAGIQVATPTLVWRDRKGQAHFITGVPNNRQFNAAMASMVEHKP